MGVGGTGTQAENPFHRLHQAKATIRSCHMFFLPLLHSREIQQVVDF